MTPVAASGASGDGPEDRLGVLRSLLLRLGRTRFGTPPPDIPGRIDRITDVAHLERLLERILTVCRWDELLAEE